MTGLEIQKPKEKTVEEMWSVTNRNQKILAPEVEL